jgi:L-alanine-DL-glutamate epimerase-like enolase superfamily enzyme
MPQRKLHVEIKELPFVAPFRISGFVFEKLDVVVVTLEEGAYRGRGEAAGVYYLGDTAQSLVAAIEARRAEIEARVDRAGLQRLMPAGGARNAVDCALWDLDAKRSGSSVFELAGLAPPKPLVTTFTLGADDPDKMAQSARGKFAEARSLKLKLTGELDLDLTRVDAVRAARPDAWIGVDANRGFEIGELDALIRGLVEADVALLEQPLARGREADLDGYVSPIPIAADESALTLADVPGLVGRFDIVNIKLDKCGGLTEGLAIAREARKLGLGVMVGNMTGTSLATAPGFVLGQLCDFVDLDGSIFIADDPEPRSRYVDGTVWCGPEIWG